MDILKQLFWSRSKPKSVNGNTEDSFLSEEEKQMNLTRAEKDILKLIISKGGHYGWTTEEHLKESISKAMMLMSRDGDFNARCEPNTGEPYDYPGSILIYALGLSEPV